tara:strand:+ start:414 stop:725 length:312 start_codon:yes stop_codon:yes gene_type:complete
MKSEINLQKSKPWNKNSSHNSFESADTIRNKLLEMWSVDSEKYAGMQVKVKRLSGDVFVVKTRLHPDFEKPSRPKREKKVRGKNSRRNRKNSSQGEADASSGV